MNVKMLSEKIKTLEEKIHCLESWQSPKTSVEVLLQQRKSDDEISDLVRTRKVLKRTSGIINKKRASIWLKEIEQSRASWNS